MTHFSLRDVAAAVVAIVVAAVDFLTVDCSVAVAVAILSLWGLPFL